MAKKQFTWNPTKAKTNAVKHGVTFEEASTVFDDSLALVEADLAHAECRLIVTGMSSRSRVLFVVTLDTDEDNYHIISARKATRHERKRYEEGQ